MLDRRRAAVESVEYVAHMLQLHAGRQEVI